MAAAGALTSHAAASAVVNGAAPRRTAQLPASTLKDTSRAAQRGSLRRITGGASGVPPASQPGRICGRRRTAQCTRRAGAAPLELLEAEAEAAPAPSEQAQPADQVAAAGLGYSPEEAACAGGSAQPVEASPSTSGSNGTGANGSHEVGVGSRQETAAAGSHHLQQQQQQRQQQQEEAEDRQWAEQEAAARRRRLWYMAVKPPMYSVAVVPLVVASAVAYWAAGTFAATRFLQLLFGSIAIIAWLNLSNDGFDAATGVDADKPESVVNLTGSRAGVLAASAAFLAAGGALLYRALAPLGDARVGYMLGAAIAAGYLYQGPPFRLSYRGLGEPLCFAAFGPLATCAFYLAMVAPVAAAAASAAPPISAAVAACSVLVGITTSVILFCSHFHQIEGDRAAGKMSPLVRLGSAQRGLQVLHLVVRATYGAAAAAALAGWLPWTAAAALGFSSTAARDFLAFADRTHATPAVKPLKLYAITWHCAVGASLVAGFGALVAAPLAAPLLIMGALVVFFGVQYFDMFQ